MRNEVLLKVNIQNTVKRRRANWIGHGLLRNCFLRNETKGKIKESA
jgi:hypothetical protein